MELLEVPPGDKEWGMGVVPGATQEASRGAASSSSDLSCVFPVLPQVVWQWKVTQAVCQALRGKKDFLCWERA